MDAAAVAAGDYPQPVAAAVERAASVARTRLRLRGFAGPLCAAAEVVGARLAERDGSFLGRLAALKLELATPARDLAGFRDDAAARLRGGREGALGLRLEVEAKRAAPRAALACLIGTQPLSLGFETVSVASFLDGR